MHSWLCHQTHQTCTPDCSLRFRRRFVIIFFNTWSITLLINGPFSGSLWVQCTLPLGQGRLCECIIILISAMLLVDMSLSCKVGLMSSVIILSVCNNQLLSHQFQCMFHHILCKGAKKIAIAVSQADKVTVLHIKTINKTCRDGLIQKLQSGRNATAYIITCLRRCYHITSVLHSSCPPTSSKLHAWYTSRCQLRHQRT